MREATAAANVLCMGKPKKIGIVTGGGDAPGLNAVIRGVAKKAMRLHGAKIYGVQDGFLGLIRNRVRVLGEDDVSGILPRGGTILGTTNKGNPLPMKKKIVKAIRDLGLDALVCLGGDGTMTIAEELFRVGAPVVGVPKTIDNDVMGVDRTFGFDSAVSICANALDDLHSTADSHGRVLVVEVMGRHAGWIALEAGIAGGADVILIPERPFQYGKIVSYIRKRHKRRRFTIVCVAEGAFAKGSKPHYKRKGKLGGVGMALRHEIEAKSGIESRAVVLGHLQRAGSPTPFDRVLATRYAAAAVDLAAEGGFGRVVALQGDELTSVTMASVAGRQRTIPEGHELITLAESVGATFG